MTLPALGRFHTVEYPVQLGTLGPQGMTLRTLAPGESQPYLLDLTRHLTSMGRTIASVAVLVDPALAGGNVDHDDRRVVLDIVAPAGSTGDRVIQVRLTLAPQDVLIWNLVQPVAGLEPAIPADAITINGMVVTVGGQPVELTALAPLPGGAQSGDFGLVLRGGVLGTLPPGSSSGGPLEYVHQQSVPSATWTITHNLGRHPAVRVLTTSNDQVDCSANFPDPNTVVLTFAAPFAGTAYL